MADRSHLAQAQIPKAIHAKVKKLAQDRQMKLVGMYEKIILAGIAFEKANRK